jgi:type I restriction enzyme S subunit
MKKYDKYKDSGVEWIGEIPNDWFCTKLKFHTRKIIDGAHFTPTYVEYSQNSVPFLRVTDLHNQYINKDEVKYIPKDEHLELIKRCNPEKGDLLLSKNGTIGLMKIIDWDWEFSIFVSLCLIKFENTLVNRFFKYFFDSNVVERQLFESSQKTSVSNLHLEKIKELRLTLPPLEEQTQIANYLDYKTTQIDKLIRKKEQLIELLKEERTAIINQAVTKGLNPNVPMKDSGIEWLGEIPEHWDRIRIKTLVSTKVTDGPHETPQWTENGIPFLSAESIKGNQIDFNHKRGFISVEQHTEYCKKSKVKNGDILFCKSGSTTGKSALVNTDIEFGIWSPLAIIRANRNKINNHYLFQSIQSNFFKRQVETSWTFGTQPNIGMGALENLWIAIPPMKEQNLIVELVNNENQRFDNILSKLSHEIELLKEYKTALISEVVTGKVDVRDEKLN